MAPMSSTATMRAEGTKETGTPDRQNGGLAPLPAELRRNYRKGRVSTYLAPWSNRGLGETESHRTIGKASSLAYLGCVPATRCKVTWLLSRTAALEAGLISHSRPHTAVVSAPE